MGPSHSSLFDIISQPGIASKYKHSNAEQADDIPRKLFALGWWLRKTVPASAAATPNNAAPLPLTEDKLEEAARREHDRWVAAQRSNGYVYGPKDDAILRTHPCILQWNDPNLPKSERDKDSDAISAIPRYLAAAGYQVIKQPGNDM